jgi:hypothetical protein
VTLTTRQFPKHSGFKKAGNFYVDQIADIVCENMPRKYYCILRTEHDVRSAPI